MVMEHLTVETPDPLKNPDIYAIRQPLYQVQGGNLQAPINTTIVSNITLNQSNPKGAEIQH